MKGRVMAMTRAPLLVAMAGLPGTGKSSVALGLSQALGLPILSVDPIESAILDAGVQQGYESGLAAYLVAERLAGDFLASGIGVVIDAVNAVPEARGTWERLAAERGGRLEIIECVITDATEHRARLAGRSRGLTMGEPAWADVERRREQWTRWTRESLVLDAMRPLDDNVREALRRLSSAGDQAPRSAG
jgi:predicted kinase